MNPSWLSSLAAQDDARHSAMRLSASVDVAELKRRVGMLGQPRIWDQLVAKVYHEVHRKLVETTPKRWTGNTRRGWVLLERKAAVRVLENKTAAARYLEYGTPRIGGTGFIYPRVKKVLFVPLTRKAAFFHRAAATWYTTAGRQPRRVAEARSEGGMLTGERKRQIVYGVDYVLAKRVKGIKPRRIAQQAQSFGQVRLVQEMEGVVRKVFNG